MSPCSKPLTPCPALPRYVVAPTLFHLEPYVPSANIPTETAPNQPQYPCTDTAPHGSSTLRTRSLKSTPKDTMMPARAPMRTAEFGPTNAHGAVIATRPASMPLHAIVMSGLPNIQYQTSRADAEPMIAARLVFTATTAMRRSVAPSVEPGLKPIQPNSRMNVPMTTKAMLCAGNATGLPSFPYLPSRGPRTTASAIAQNPPTACTTVDPAKSTYPWAMCIVVPSCDIQPPPQTQQPKIG